MLKFLKNFHTNLNLTGKNLKSTKYAIFQTPNIDNNNINNNNNNNNNFYFIFLFIFIYLFIFYLTRASVCLLL